MSQPDTTAPPSKRPKIELACDSCRSRKTRCDGKRPVCTLCSSSLRRCTYRDVSGNQPSDVSILDRLSDAERRLRIIESEPMRMVVCPDPRWSSGVDGLLQTPQLHTAAGHRILEGWPRLRVHFTLPSIEPSLYPQAADAADTCLNSSLVDPAQILNMEPFLELLAELYANIQGIPTPLECLIRSTEIFSKDSLLAGYSVGNSYRVGINSLSTPFLLLSTLAAVFITDYDGLLDGVNQFNIPAAQALFHNALQRCWVVYAEPTERQIPVLLLMAYIHVYIFSRPFHAIGLFRHIGSLLTSPESSAHVDQLKTWTQLHFLLESDLFTELDGISTTPSQFFDAGHVWNNTHDGMAVHEPVLNPAPITTNKNGEFMHHNMWLRLCQNKILTELYTASKAYCHPSTIGDSVSHISRLLEDWYRSLPLGMQFSRNLPSSRMGAASRDPKLDELSQRYFACTFMLNRPVLYFVLHEDLEQITSPAEVASTHQGIQPWMYDACKVSVRSALYILASRLVSRRYNNWCDNQLLLAAHLMTMQAILNSDISEVQHEFQDLESLLDGAESALENAPLRVVADEWGVAILRNVRQNVSNSITAS